MIARRRRLGGKRYSATLHYEAGNGESHGLGLDLGVYVSRIAAGSAAAKEGSIAVGDRIVSINNRSLEYVTSITPALNLINPDPGLRSQTLSLTLAKSSGSVDRGGLATFSSSSAAGSGQSSQHQLPQLASPKSGGGAAAALPPLSPPHSNSSVVKETLRGSQEFVKKLIKGSSNSEASRYGTGMGSGSSSERVYHNQVWPLTHFLWCYRNYRDARAQTRLSAMRVGTRTDCQKQLTQTLLVFL